MDPSELEFLQAWKKFDGYGSGSLPPYGDIKTTNMTKTFVGLTMKQLVSKGEWTGNSYSCPGRLLFHRMMIVKGRCCPDCLDPVFMLGADDEPLSSLPCQTEFWTRDQDQDELALVHNTVPEATMEADTLGFWAWHLHHMNMKSNHEDYIVPSALPKYTLPFGTLPKEGETLELKKGTRLWHYSLLQINCNKCHEQGESRKYWTPDMEYVSPIYYPLPKNPLSIREVLGGQKYQAYKKALIDYKLDNYLTLSRLTFEELNYVCVNTLGYEVKDLVTFSKEIYEITRYQDQRPMFMKMIALNFIKKECGLCIGRGGASACPSRDIRNIVPRRLNGIHGDHGEGAGKKKFNPTNLVTKTWAELEAEMIKLDGNRCGHCHRGK